MIWLFHKGLYYSRKSKRNLENYVQKLRSAGVGARNLQECLLLQIEKKVSRDKAVILAGIF